MKTPKYDMHLDLTRRNLKRYGVPLLVYAGIMAAVTLIKMAGY